MKFIIVLVNVVLTVFLIQWNALYGAVLGTFMSLMLGDVVVMQIVFKKDIGLSLGKYYWNVCKGILPALAIATAAGFAFRLIGLGGWLGFIVNCLVMVSAYALCMFTFGMNAYEKKLLGSVFKKFRKKEKELK